VTKRASCWVALLALAACRADTFGAQASWPRPKGGMVVCEQPLAAQIGVDVLERGGNAADAAVATALALAVVYPQAGNLGGGGFALWVPHEGEPNALDFRETAPSDALRERYFDTSGKPLPQRALEGALASGVPGSPAGLYALHQKYGSGKFSWAQLVKPAAQLARKGFAVDAKLAHDLVEAHDQLAASPGAQMLFFPNGVALAQGAQLVQPDLAKTLDLLARDGPSAFYSGATARHIVEELDRCATAQVAAEDDERLRGGRIRAVDLASYQPKWREPLRGWFRGREVITMPPPSSGGIILLQVLALLDGFPLDAERRRALGELSTASGASPVDAQPCGLSARAVHWWIEALRRGFAARAHVMGDPDFVDVPVDQLLAPAAIARDRIAIGESAQLDLVDEPPREGSQTTQISVIDREGNAVSLTTTLNSFFGSGTFVRGAGFFLNNELDDFALGGGVANQFGLVGSEANAIAPRKRPLSSMTPTVVRDGGHSVSMVLGSPGGPRIITAVIGVLLRTIVYGEALETAVAAPRFHQQWSPPQTLFEPGWPQPLLDELRRRGQPLELPGERWASVQAIRVGEGGIVEGASDPRRAGVALATRD
jgi:gamma-glutamyltranspeptidase/glutathione hydrolase